MKDNLGAKKWWVAGAMALATIAFSLDLTVLNLALPTLATSLHASSSQLQWVIGAYALALAVSTIPAGLLGDRYGRKIMLLLALGLFGAASLMCAYSATVDILIASRVALGIGAAFILPLSFALLSVFFDGAERQKAISLMMAGTFVAYPLGPILGGWMLTHFWWGSVFLLNVPIVLLAVITLAILLPENKAPANGKIDTVGITLSGLGLIGLTYGAIRAESSGWISGAVCSAIVLGIVVLTIFVLWEKRLAARGSQPLVDLSLFQSRGFTWGTLLMTLVNFAMFGLFFGLPQFFQAVQQHDALYTGYLLLPMISGLLVGMIVTNKVTRKIGAKLAVALGFAIMCLGLFAGAWTQPGSSDVYISFWIAVVGFGLGFLIPATADAVLGSLTRERSGSGSALMTAIRQVGSTFGVAILGTVLGLKYRAYLDAHNIPHNAVNTVKDSVEGGVVVANSLHSQLLLGDVMAAFSKSLDYMLLVCAVIAAIASILSLIYLPSNSNTQERSNIRST